MALLAPFPYFDGPSDPARLRDYLNELIRFLNELNLLTVTGGVAENVTTQTYTVVVTDGLIRCDCTAAVGPIVITLLPIAQALLPRLVIGKIDKNMNLSVTVQTSGDGSTIGLSGATSIQFSSPGQWITLDPRSGTTWDIVS